MLPKLKLSFTFVKKLKCNQQFWNQDQNKNRLLLYYKLSFEYKGSHRNQGKGVLIINMIYYLLIWSMCQLEYLIVICHIFNHSKRILGLKHNNNISQCIVLSLFILLEERKRKKAVQKVAD